MTARPRMKVVLADEIPEELAELTLYVSFEFATAVHLCACGCGNESVTPLRPTDWRLIYDGSFTLSPSVGNWALPCRSHYLIIREEVVWAGQWDQDRIDVGRELDRRAKRRYFDEDAEDEDSGERDEDRPPRSWWDRIFGRGD